MPPSRQPWPPSQPPSGLDRGGEEGTQRLRTTLALYIDRSTTITDNTLFMNTPEDDEALIRRCSPALRPPPPSPPPPPPAPPYFDSTCPFSLTLGQSTYCTDGTGAQEVYLVTTDGYFQVGLAWPAGTASNAYCTSPTTLETTLVYTATNQSIVPTYFVPYAVAINITVGGLTL